MGLGELTWEQLVSGLPPRSKARVDLTNSFLDELWNSLQHPPLSYMGDRFAYRSADGSYNVRRWRPALMADGGLMRCRTSCIRIWAPRTPPTPDP